MDLEKKMKLMTLMSKTEKEFNLDVYHRFQSTVEEYSELAIQFGYVTLFVAAFPLAPLFALASNFVKLRIDGYKILSTMRRPMPSGCQGIGIWLDIFQILSLVAVITNAGIIAFTMNPNETDEVGSYNLFLTMQYTLFILMACSSYFVPDVPSSVPIQLKRQEVLLNKVIKGIPDPEKRVFPPYSKDVRINNEEDKSQEA